MVVPDTVEMNHSSRFAQMYRYRSEFCKNLTKCISTWTEEPITKYSITMSTWGNSVQGICECFIDFSNLSRISHLWGHIFRTVKIGQEKDDSRRLLYRYHVSWPSFWIPYWYGGISLLNQGRNPVVCQKVKSNIFPKDIRDYLTRVSKT